VHETIFSGEDLALDVFDGGHPVSIVTFESRDRYLATDGTSPFGPGFGRDRFAPLGMNEYLIRRNRNHWYQSAEIDAVAELVTRRAAGTRVVTYGSSMGAYAAVNFARLLNADTFIAISPLFDVEPGNALGEQRWREDWPHTDFSRNLIKAGDCAASKGYVFYDEGSPDRQHAEEIARHTAATLVPLEHGGHPSGFYLNATYKIKRLVAEIAAESFDEPTFRRDLSVATAETHYPYERQAKILEKDGNLDGAIEQLTTAIEKNDALPRLHVALGNHLLRRGDAEAAERAFARAIEIDPTAPDVHVRLSHAHAAQADHARAVASARRAVAIRPDKPEFHLRLGEWLLANGDLDDAERAMLRAIELKPDATAAPRRLAVVRERRAKILEKDGNLDGAIEQLRLAIETSGGLPRLHVALGNHLLRRGDAEAAEREFARAIEIDPTVPNAHVRLSHAHAAQADHARAVASMRRAVAISPNTPEFHLRLGEWLLANDDLDDAERAMLRAIELKPDARTVPQRLAVVRARRAETSDRPADRAPIPTS
jgi:Flp pilus assembly protein TadD